MRRQMPLLVGLVAVLAAVAPTVAHAAPGAQTAQYTAIPPVGVSRATLAAESASSATVPTWSGSIVSPLNGATYQYTMVGNDPTVPESSPITTVGVDLIPVQLVFSNGTTDPTVATPGCSTKTPLALTKQSPVFTQRNYTAGTTVVGDHQYVDAFQRENFAQYVLAPGAVNPKYNVRLALTTEPTLTVDVPSADGAIYTIGSGPCPNEGKVDLTWWDNYMQSIMPTLQSSGETSTTQLPFFLFSNSVLFNAAAGACCTLGFHGAATGGSPGVGTQTYALADYDTTKLLSGTRDIAPISHEVAEWMDDPFVDNYTPAWGHVGQLGQGCSVKLEVGDPLTGTSVPIKMPNGVTYHPQDLAFLSWFYRQDPSIGVNGWYSSNDTFTSDAGPACQ